jgi:putative RecB family exonuclease
MNRITSDRDQASQVPHLSHSRIDRYLRCPEQYRLYYIEKVRARLPSANLIFGQIQHRALAELFEKGLDPIEVFASEWNRAREDNLDYGAKQSWESLNERGQLLLEKFVREQFSEIGLVKGVEQDFRLDIEGLDLPFIGIIDLVTEKDGITSVVDFKTAGSAYAGHEVMMSDQLSAYQLAVPNAEKLELCVFVKTKEPKIEWHISQRSGPRLIEYLNKVKFASRQIKDLVFYKRSGEWCRSCEYLALCTGDELRAKQKLVRI